MKVLIVDDEAPARERLRRQLAELGGAVTCGEAATGREALTAAAACQPDVVLMDIRMPGMDGLEAARHLAELAPAPAVIFTTAYGDHALAAFETHAVDYLLKPIRSERLAEALAAARRLTRAQALDLARDAGEESARRHICARVRGDLQLVPVEEVRYFQADRKYVTVVWPGGQVLVEDSLKTLEQEFAGRFIRIHRNALVAVAHLDGVEKDAEGRCRVRLKGVDERLEVSRRHLAELRRTLREI